MIFICSFIFLFIFFCVFMFLFTGGIVVYSKDKLPKVETVQPIAQVETVKTPKAEKKYYINIDRKGTLIEITKSEVAGAKKNGYTIVEK